MNELRMWIYTDKKTEETNSSRFPYLVEPNQKLYEMMGWHEPPEEFAEFWIRRATNEEIIEWLKNTMSRRENPVLTKRGMYEYDSRLCTYPGMPITDLLFMEMPEWYVDDYWQIVESKTTGGERYSYFFHHPPALTQRKDKTENWGWEKQMLFGVALPTFTDIPRNTPYEIRI